MSRRPAIPRAVDASLSGWASFATHPVRETFQVVLLARQPYLSSVLPMYVIFALCVPAAVPFAVPPAFKTSETARWLVRCAFAAVARLAAVKRFVLTQPMPGAMKQHLAFARVVNVIGIAMVAAYFVHRGTIAWIAARVPAVVTVGRTGLVCFVGGTLISVIVDTATPHALHGVAAFAAALAGDIVAIGATLMLAKTWRGTPGGQKEKARASVNGAGCG